MTTRIRCGKRPLRLLPALFLLVLLAWPAVLVAEIPPVLYTAEAHHEYPVWVSADAAITVEGRVDPALFRQSDKVFQENHVLDTPRPASQIGAWHRPGR